MRQVERPNLPPTPPLKFGQGNGTRHEYQLTILKLQEAANALADANTRETLKQELSDLLELSTRADDGKLRRWTGGLQRATASGLNNDIWAVINAIKAEAES